MGGNAFKTLLQNSSFPRMHPTVYNALKSQLLPVLQAFYAHATVAPECPGKNDFGDIDIIVAGPREGLTHEELKKTLRATCSIPLEGPRTSHFAIPMDAFEHVRRAHESVAATAKLNHTEEGCTTEDAEMFVQVDVNVCEDHTQFERTVFYSSFGDLGYILGLLAQTAGLSFSNFGLKLAEPIVTSPPQTFYLSTSMSNILTFFGLNMDRWARGFASQEEVFIWIASSPFTRPLAARYRSPEFRPSLKRRVDVRPMRLNFVSFMQTHYFPEVEGTKDQELFAAPGREEEKVDAALRYFDRYEEHARLLYLSSIHTRAKEILSGKNIHDWTGATGVPIRFVMNEVKERLPGFLSASGGEHPAAGEVPKWQRALSEMSDDAVRALVVSTKEEMQADGRLEFNWKAARAAKLQRKQKELENGDPPAHIEEKVATVAVV